MILLMSASSDLIERLLQKETNMDDGNGYRSAIKVEKGFPYVERREFVQN